MDDAETNGAFYICAYQARVQPVVLVDVNDKQPYRYEVMRSLIRALKPAGRVVRVKYRGEDPAVPIKPLQKGLASQQSVLVQRTRATGALRSRRERKRERSNHRHAVMRVSAELLRLQA